MLVRHVFYSWLCLSCVSSISVRLCLWYDDTYSADVVVNALMVKLLLIFCVALTIVLVVFKGKILQMRYLTVTS